ncbi:MAG: DUF364 domain-containing protein [Methanobacterium sp.]|jgi:uncharacterized protein (DUF4213/DUF364 family)|nr:DUF364 domain-containing protein [Methanobacterium sp.]
MLLNKTMQPSKILEETIDYVKNSLNDIIHDITIERAVIGIFFSGVILNNGHAGISATPIKEIPEAVCCPSSARSMPNAGHLTERSVVKYLKDATSNIPMKKAMGIAVLSALSSYCREIGLTEGYDMEVGVDALDCVDLRDDTYPVLIGAIGPFLRVLKSRKKPFSVVELDTRTLKPDELPFYVPPDKTGEIVPKADVLVITGTTLINGTLEGILEIARPDTKVVVVGPTASILPHAFFKRGVDILGGDIITHPQKMLDTLAEGGSGYHLYGHSAERVLVTQKSPGFNP